ncbi:Gfo/Idh/MocA family oxidoreductase [Oscillochloris sp. ZM17-4]|uniref:Gfo/Idh/MocA family protein n=1 Tax=Oscillochloris sp. ZM17-4 TaxID=2866714 RepID=UPI001C729F80|nr:Gfo/Idh/MocA family oxidoreductase [Oscillochloris sp. ZM17-4]MBX0328491.1 Gfo/Idh/MocA family oxidoreductase [Oscillochloris sp. ZM17-4]
MTGIGIIGTGWGARVQVPAFRGAGLEVVALAGSQADKTARIAGELGVAWHTASWRALLERPDVDVVSIVTPPGLHREIAAAALEAGRHVLCEKPTAMDVAEAEAMLAAAEAHPAQLAMIDHELRFLPALRLARSLIARGEIGAVRHAEIRSLSSSRSDPRRAWSWWSDASQGGGVLGAIGSHQIDTLRYLLSDEVAVASGITHTFIAERPDDSGRPRPVTADDYAAASLRFVGGATATIMASVVAPHDEPNSATVYGVEGALRFVGGRLLRSAGGAFADITPEHGVDFPEGISGDFPQGTVYLGVALKAALAGDAAALAPAATFADGLAVQRALDAIRAGG